VLVDRADQAELKLLMNSGQALLWRVFGPGVRSSGALRWARRQLPVDWRSDTRLWT